MGLVAATAGLFAVGAYLDRNLAYPVTRHGRGATEAVINTLKRALAELEPGSEIVSLTLSALEPPSAMLTLRRAFPHRSRCASGHRWGGWWGP